MSGRENSRRMAGYLYFGGQTGEKWEQGHNVNGELSLAKEGNKAISLPFHVKLSTAGEQQLDEIKSSWLSSLSLNQ